MLVVKALNQTILDINEILSQSLIQVLAVFHLQVCAMDLIHPTWRLSFTKRGNSMNMRICSSSKCASVKNRKLQRRMPNASKKKKSLNARLNNLLNHLQNRKSVIFVET